MLIGYARTSTIDQIAGLDAQLRDLQAAGCERIWREQASSVGTRAELAACLDFAREGDALIVTRLDRLARSIAHLVEITRLLARKGVALRILSLGIDTGTASGQLILTMLGAIGEFERALMLERQAEGIARAKAEGRYTGRQPTAMRQAAAIRRLKAEGWGATQIARKLGIHRASVYRALQADPAADPAGAQG